MEASRPFVGTSPIRARSVSPPAFRFAQGEDEAAMLKRAFTVAKPESRAIARFKALERLDQNDIDRIARAATDARFFPARTELARERGEPARPSILLRGWLAHQRILPDGRRQIVGFTLAGEMFGRNWSCQDMALTSQIALTDVLVCAAPVALDGTRLRDAYRKERLGKRLQLIDNVTRLGRMDAKERVCDFLLEILERLQLSGEARDNAFDMPLTQECFADAVGLTPVHLNRTIQACRRGGEISWSGGRVTIHDPAALARSLGRKPHLSVMTAINSD
jgi:CRP-like cAMP-binding protein